MKYRLPTLEDYEIIKDYVIEHYSNGERRLNASLYLTETSYPEWVEKINKNANESTDEWGKYYLYLVFNEENKLVGLLNIRFNLSENLREKYGDIGYGVRPSERRKGYATKMLKYALDICKEKGLNYAIIGCYEKNFGSNKTIQKNGGVLYRNDMKEIIISDDWKINLKMNFYKIML